jgi:hypothetical protein
MRRRVILWMLLTAAAGAATAAVAFAGGGGVNYTNLPAANVKAAGYAPSDVLSPELRQSLVAQGSMALDGAQGAVGWYGYINDAPSPDDSTLPQMVGTPASPAEAQKTEPDKNTYLVLKNQTGADPTYDYGTHFLFQGHEVGAAIPNSDLTQGYITRINLDADVAHRVTLLATTDSEGNPIQGIDGSTWDPWAKRLLLTTEDSSNPTYAATATYPSTVTDVSGALGRGGYEGSRTIRQERLDRRGRQRCGEERHEGEATQQLHLPLRTGAAWRPRERQAPGPAGLGWRPSGDLRLASEPQQQRPGRPPHLREDVRNEVGDDPRHRHRRKRTIRLELARKGCGRDTVQAARERAVPARLRFHTVLLRRDR